LFTLATFTASIVIGSVTPLVYVYERGWRVGSDWKPLLFTLYASIIAGSLIIDTTTALALHSIPPASARYVHGLSNYWSLRTSRRASNRTTTGVTGWIHCNEYN
jgi:hypothetical protein